MDSAPAEESTTTWASSRPLRLGPRLIASTSTSSRSQAVMLTSPYRFWITTRPCWPSVYDCRNWTCGARMTRASRQPPVTSAKNKNGRKFPRTCMTPPPLAVGPCGVLMSLSGFDALFHNAAVKQPDGAIGELRVAWIVGHHADGGSGGMQFL